MHNSRRVVVTGMGVCTPLGTDVQELWENSLAGKSGVRPIENFKTEPGFTRVGGMALQFEPASIYTPGPKRPNQDRTYLMAAHCIRKALMDSGLSDQESLASCGLFISSAIAEMASMEYAFIDSNPCPPEFERFSFGSLAGRLAASAGLHGGHMLIPTGCVGGCDSIGYGVDMIRSGRFDRVVAGAAEAPITPLVVAAFGRIRANSTRECEPQEASCPFDTRRDGFVLAEGAAMFVLESEDSARARKATILAEVYGSASVNNCFHMTDIHPDGEAIAEVCRLALADASLEPRDIDHINAHGSSTPQNDHAESAAIRKVFGKYTDRIPITSLKSQCGHALSAANAIEMVSTICSIRQAEIPPTINLRNQDPACQVTVVDRREHHRIRHALKVSSGFSGIHTAVVISEYH